MTAPILFIVLLAVALTGCATQDSARPNHLPVVQACFLASCTVQGRTQMGTDLTGGAGEMQATETTAIPVVSTPKTVTTPTTGGK